MDKIAVNWEPILWVGGVFLAIISGLLGWIAILLKADKVRAYESIKLNRDRLDKHETWILSLQTQVAESQKQTALTIQAIQIDQKHYRHKIETFDRDLADSIIQKLGAITPRSEQSKKKNR